MPRKKKIEVESKEIESKEMESKEMESKEMESKEIESTPKEIKDNRTLAQKLANYKRPLRRI